MASILPPRAAPSCWRNSVVDLRKCSSVEASAIHNFVKRVAARANGWFFAFSWASICIGGDSGSAATTSANSAAKASAGILANRFERACKLTSTDSAQSNPSSSRRRSTSLSEGICRPTRLSVMAVIVGRFKTRSRRFRCVVALRA